MPREAGSRQLGFPGSPRPRRREEIRREGQDVTPRRRWSDLLLVRSAGNRAPRYGAELPLCGDTLSAGETEFAEHTFSSGLASSYARRENFDFVWHFYTGGGRTVTLEEIGHLREIAEHHAYATGNEGAFRRLSDQIADAARDSTSGSVHHDFNNVYDFGDVAFSHGLSIVHGAFDGTAERRGNMISIVGEEKFNFKDAFTDPANLREFAASLKDTPSRLWHLMRRIGAFSRLADQPSKYRSTIDPEDVSSIYRFVSELGGTRYDIIGFWTTSFRADIFEDRTNSAYLDPRRG